MTNPINTSTNTGKSALSASSVVGDWASRLTGPQGASDPTAMQSDFSHWLDKHAMATPQTQPKAADNQANANAPKSSQTGLSASASLEARNVAGRAEAKALAARRQAAEPKAGGSKPGASAPTQAKAPQSQAPAKAEATKAKDKGDKGGKDVAKTSNKDDAASMDQALASADDTTPTMAMGEVSAPVKEQAAPDTIQVGNSAGMLAWLASLTHGEAAAKTGLPEGDATASGGEAKVPSGVGHAEVSALLGDPQGSGRAGSSNGRAVAMTPLDNAKPALDVSAMQLADGRLTEVLGGATEQSSTATDFAGALSAEMMRGAGLSGQAMQVQGPATHISEALPTPLGSPEFAPALAERVSMWVKSAGEGASLTAELHLNPAEMGPISVKIALDGHSAQVDFAATALETRRAIEESLPMLSTALDEVGLKLGGSGVSDQPAQQQFSPSSGQASGTPSWGRAGHGLNASSSDPDVVGAAAAPRRGGLKGGLDLYA
ncbi:MAG: flagellar hook-length control protein FliK [Burkholderiales bacterium]|nr:flagellar hook-length control protein FliK [Burkholderiales bacterium]